MTALAMGAVLQGVSGGKKPQTQVAGNGLGASRVATSRSTAHLPLLPRVDHMPQMLVACRWLGTELAHRGARCKKPRLDVAVAQVCGPSDQPTGDCQCDRLIGSIGRRTISSQGLE
jgi:hypothetical protein